MAELGPWPQHVVEILDGDLVVALGTRTPAGGVVVTPMAPLGDNDPASGTVGVSTSLAFPSKLRRIASDDRVGILYHAREHGFAGSTHHVLVQGRASFPDTPDGFWTEALEERWNRFLVPRKRGRLWDWLGWEYYDLRVSVTVHVHRIVVWPSEPANEGTEVLGPPLPGPPREQSPPAGGEGPRVPYRRYQRRLRRSRHILLGHVGDDGFPMLAPVSATRDGDWLILTGPGLPEGRRRAGLLGHWYKPALKGQGQVVLTGWLRAEEGRGTYAPRTCAGYVMPPVGDLGFSLAVSLGGKFRYRRAARLGEIENGRFRRDWS